MIAIAPRDLTSENFFCLENAQKEHQELIRLAKYNRSNAEKFYLLACAFKDENRHLIRIERNQSVPRMKIQYGKARRAA